MGCCGGGVVGVGVVGGGVVGVVVVVGDLVVPLPHARAKRSRNPPASEKTARNTPRATWVRTADTLIFLQTSAWGYLLAAERRKAVLM